MFYQVHNHIKHWSTAMDSSNKHIFGILYNIKKIKLDNHVEIEAYTYRLDWFSKHLPALVQVFTQASFIDLNCELWIITFTRNLNE